MGIEQKSASMGSGECDSGVGAATRTSVRELLNMPNGAYSIPNFCARAGAAQLSWAITARNVPSEPSAASSNYAVRRTA